MTPDRTPAAAEDALPVAKTKYDTKESAKTVDAFQLGTDPAPQWFLDLGGALVIDNAAWVVQIGGLTAVPGSWIVNHPTIGPRIYTDAEFKALFQ